MGYARCWLGRHLALLLYPHYRNYQTSLIAFERNLASKARTFEPYIWSPSFDAYVSGQDGVKFKFGKKGFSADTKYIAFLDKHQAEIETFKSTLLPMLRKLRAWARKHCDDHKQKAVTIDDSSNGLVASAAADPFLPTTTAEVGQDDDEDDDGQDVQDDDEDDDDEILLACDELAAGDKRPAEGAVAEAAAKRPALETPKPKQAEKQAEIEALKARLAAATATRAAAAAGLAMARVDEQK